MLSIPLSEWTIEKLEFLEFLDRIDQEVHRRGCYLLVVYDLKGLQVELYSGASNDMRKRYKEHLACIRRAGRPSARVLHFHRRCHALARRNGPGRYKTLLIPLSHEPDYDQEALDFDESCHIATFGLWQRSNAPPARLTAWKVVQSMKLDSGDKLPDGWNGANREIPFVAEHFFDLWAHLTLLHRFNPTRGRRKWL